MQERDLFTANVSTTVRFDDVRDLIRDTLKKTVLGLTEFFPGLTARWALDLFSKPRMKMRKPRGPFAGFIPQTIEVDGLKAKVYQFGDEDLPKVLIVHGWEGLAQDFYILVEELLAHGYGVVTFDGPAHHPLKGELGSKTNALEFAKIISHLALVHGPFKGIIAHSFGGFASSIALADYQTQVAEKLIMIGSPNRLSRVLDAFSNFIGLPKSVRQKMDELIERDFKLIVSETTSANNLKRARGVDVLVVHDENDDQVPVTTAMEIKHQLPESTLLVTQGLGHNRILKNREVALTLIQYLQGQKHLLDSASLLAV